MRLRARFVAGLSATALLLAGCASGGSSDGGSEGSASDGAASQDVCESAEGDGPKIGLAYDVGGVGDFSFNDSAYAGLTQAVKELDATCAEAEAGAGESDADREQRLRDLADAGYTAIVGVGFVYSVAVYNVAPEYPDTYFGIIDGFNPTKSQKDLPNVANIGFAANEGSFLVGAAAALTTKTDHVGFLGGVDGPLIQAFEAGYVAGVEEVNPDIEIDSQYLSQDDPVKGFENPAGGKTAATGMYDNGADVVYHAAGKSGLGLFDAVEAAGKGNWAIGVDSDQYLTADPAQQPFILTSMLKRVDTGVFEFAKGVDEGQPPSGYVTYDLASGGVDYATSGDFLSAEIISQIDDYKQQIIDGTIKVPAETTS
ncbi:MAG: BMP family ABC transporter substrate-binding protein [Actinomycetota bacterium]|nr:BMP family ABC transporter substrate-binding protein [Actinomycetota bacterium]